MTLSLIVALSWPGRVIGRDNGIPWKLSEDLKRFKALTLGHPVLMGRKTWESLPFKLPGRSNGVLSRGSQDLATPRGETPDFRAQSLPKALAQAALLPGGEEVFVIGGAQIYAATLALADRLVLTQIHHPFEGDALFPAFDPASWDVTLREPHQHAGEPSFKYDFLELRRKASQAAH